MAPKRNDSGGVGCEDLTMRIEQTFATGAPPEKVFAFMAAPANLRSWQTSVVEVEPLTDGPPRLGYRVRERMKAGLRQWDQIVEFTEFEPGSTLATHIVEGPMPVDGRWTFRGDGAGNTRVYFVAEGELRGTMRMLEPLVRLGMSRSFRRSHGLLARQVESS
jgi:uncharacterized protein YndB with AHSA1/START domain